MANIPFYANPQFGRSAVVIHRGDEKSQFRIFAKGYFKAAREVMRTLLGQPGFPVYDAYPAIFLFRHSLELYLKHTIYFAAKVAVYKRMSALDITLWNTHKITTLAKKASEILLQLFPHDLKLASFLGRLQQVCGELEDIDADSFVYRYPVNKDGSRAAKGNQMIYLESFSNTMNAVLDGLDAIDLGLSIEQDLVQSTIDAIGNLLDQTQD